MIATVYYQESFPLQPLVQNTLLSPLARLQHTAHIAYTNCTELSRYLPKVESGWVSQHVFRQ